MIPNGKCQGCDAYGETDDMSLCEDCYDTLEMEDEKIQVKHKKLKVVYSVGEVKGWIGSKGG